MKFWKKLVSGILSAAVMVSVMVVPVSVSANAVTDANGYVFKDGKIVDYPHGQQHLVFPSTTPDGKKVSEIDVSIVENNVVKSITISVMPTWGGTLKVSSCDNLEWIREPNTVIETFPNNYAILDTTVSYCKKLSSINIPEGTGTLPPYYLHYCPNVKELYIPNSVGRIFDTPKSVNYTSVGSFEGSNPVLIVEPGSYAEQWAKKEGRPYRYPSSSTANGWVQNTSGQWQYYQNGTALTGWQKINGLWYYMDSDTYMHKSWLKQGDDWYYCHYIDGYMMTGWIRVGGLWYYLDGNGKMLTGWQKVGGNWYYLNSSGAMLTGWQNLNGVWYYLDSSGAMKTGWQYLGGKWYYLYASGAMLTGWQLINGKWYYLEPSGAMHKSWLKDGNTWYYCHYLNGDMMTGWIRVGGKWYYLDGSGRMLANTTTPDGYRVGPDGAMI